ncbi:MAG TPA: methyltransferase domain-containing protein [bacterium]|nr:methyltransferase domain-containing protein [bacterium]
MNATKAAKYVGYFDKEVLERKENYASLVNTYYELVTDFYEFGWGRSFHFAPRRRGESFKDSLTRMERYLAQKLGLAQHSVVLDAGCGVGGPMREIARYTGARIVGININADQVTRARKYNRAAQLDGQCSVVHGDFMELPVEDASFDAAFAIEATCHAPDRTASFSEIARALRPGGLFAVQEWCMTDAYEPGNPLHEQLKHDIEVGDALPELTGTNAVDEAFIAAGFEILMRRDLRQDSDPELPWYHPLTGRELSLSGLPRTQFGRKLTNRFVHLLEKLRLAPKGTKAVSDMLMRTSDALVAAGELGIFTPMYFVLARR